MCMDLEGNKSDEEEQIPYDFTYMWNLKNKTKQNKNKLIDTENRLVVARGGEGWAKWVKAVKRYKFPVINKS